MAYRDKVLFFVNDSPFVEMVFCTSVFLSNTSKTAFR